MNTAGKGATTTGSPRRKSRNWYRWKGRNYNGQSAPEITELVRAWLKETYPRYTFSVRRDGYNSILIRLMKADFEAFTRESGKVQGDINHYSRLSPESPERYRETSTTTTSRHRTV